MALFLFGMGLMGDGLKRVAGNRLELILYRLTSTPLKGVLLGTGVTAIIQSSSATSVMVVGFVNSGMMKVRQAIGIVLGAILGTSITGWIICLSYIEGGSGLASLLSTDTLTGVIAVIGIILRMFSKDTAKKHLGDILLGFAVLMFGMKAMSTAVSPLRDSAWFISFLTTLTNPLVGILAGTVFTSVLQSASAAVGVVQALSVTGAITFETALPFIMGVGIGAAVPVLLSALGAGVDGRRTALAYLLIDVLGVVIWAPIFYIANAIIGFSFMGLVMNPISVALMNTLLRLATLLVLAPFLGQLERLTCWLIRSKDGREQGELEIDRLEERFLDHPALAVEQSRIAVNAMAIRAQDNLAESFELLKGFTEKLYQQVLEQEDTVDRYEDKLGTYLVKITGKELTARQSGDVSKFLHTIGDFERISDHAVNIAQGAREIHQKHIAFSSGARRELEIICASVGEIVSLVTGAFIHNDLAQAVQVEPLEELIDNLCDEMKLHHIDRLRSGECTLDHGFVFNDLLNNLERVADHCSNIAVAMIELESDSFDTHEYLNSVKKLRSGNFDLYYDEYSRKFHL